MATTRSALVTILFVVGLLAVSAQGQVAMAPTPQALVPGMAPAAGPVFQPTGSPNYISYLALGANRAPCPSATGRSYYTQNCTEQPAATPYTRSCVQITRCARG